MEGHKRRRIFPTYLLLVIGILLAACSPGLFQEEPRETPEGTYAVDPTFREFYGLLGGEGVLGYAISPSFSFQDTQLQYTENALMRYDPKAASAQQYSLAPLGMELDVKDAPIVLPKQDGARIVDGYVIYDEFLGLYDQLQGARFTGRPLTQVRINNDYGRIEQYFTGVGFYRLLSDPPGKVHLLAYGAWKCDLACRSQPPANAIVSRAPYFAEPMVESLARLGSDFTGRPISPPYLAADGMLEQAYENLIVYADPGNIRRVRLRPIAQMVGYSPAPLAPRIEDPRMRFYELQDGMGHNVPIIFDDYIALHGGMEMAEEPISEIFAEGQVYRQCFTSYCLDFDPAAASELRVRPAALGSLYLQLSGERAPAPELNLTADSVTLEVSVANEMIASSAEQEIRLQVVERASGRPIPNLEARLEVTLPDGASQVYHFPPTGEDGRSVLVLPAVRAPNGSLVVFHACLNASSEAPACVTDSYVVWGE